MTSHLRHIYGFSMRGKMENFSHSSGGPLGIIWNQKLVFYSKCLCSIPVVVNFTGKRLKINSRQTLGVGWFLVRTLALFFFHFQSHVNFFIGHNNSFLRLFQISLLPQLIG